jgi:hypothetical protein
VLQENDKMFNGTLGVYPHKKVHIDIDPNAKPVRSRPYPVPQIYLKTFKIKLNHLVRIGVLASQQESEWASPSIIIPKKDGRVRWISNLRQLNKVIRCNQYPLLIITDSLRKHSGNKFFTKLDNKPILTALLFLLMGMNIFLNIFFNREVKSQIPKRLPGGTKCTYKVLASKNQKKGEG